MRRPGVTICHMSPLPIDLDSESIQLENGWYTRDELARKIRAMLDSGDFSIGRPSQALEELTTVLNSLQTLAFRVTPEMADTITAEASRRGKTVASLVRDAVASMLALPSTEVGGGARGSSNPEVPIVPEPIEPPLQYQAPAKVALAPPPLAAAQRASSESDHPRHPPSVVVDSTAIAGNTCGSSSIRPAIAGSPIGDPPKANEGAPKTKKEEDIEQRWFGG